MRLLSTLAVAGVLLFTRAEAGNVFVRSVEQFEKYVLRLAPGDTIKLRSGDDEWRDVNLVFEGEGEPGKPIVLAAQRAGETVFTGRSRLRILGRHLVVSGLVFRDGSLSGGSVISIGSRRGVSAQDCRLTNTAIIGYNPEDRKVSYKWVSVYGKNNRVDYCYFVGQNHTGQTLVVWLNDEPNGHRIDHNFFGGRQNLGWNGGETIRIGTSGRSMQNSRTIVEDNLFENCDGEVEIISVKSCENVIRRNAFVSSAGTVTLRHGNRNRIVGNWFLGNGKARTGGVRVIGENHVVLNNHFEGLTGVGGRSAISLMSGVPDAALSSYWRVKGALIAHNTLIDCASLFDIAFGAGGRGRTLAPRDVIITANLVAAAAENAIIVRDSSSVVKWLRNVWVGETDPGLDGFETRGTTFTRGELVSRPDDPAALTISAGDESVSMDIDGQPRRKGMAGCDVESDSPIRHFPPSRHFVGPDWMSKARPRECQSVVVATPN